MATTEPLTGATVYDNNDAALGGQQIGDVVTDLAPFGVPRFATPAARDSAYAAFVAAGGTLANGMLCWCESPGSYYERQVGAWVPRARVVYNPAALDGTPLPANARLVQVRTSYVTNVTNAGGGFQVLFGFSFTKLLCVSLTPGDSTGGVGFIVPIVANHTLSSAGGAAYQLGGAVVPSGSTIRVEVNAIGYIL